MKRALTLLILDGWGIGRNDATNPIHVARPENINYIKQNYRAGSLQASGIAVGLPWGEEGNSEVGHMTIGAGKIIYQHYPRITIAIRNKSFFKNEMLKNAFEYAIKNNVAVNCIGLLTSGNVHASFEHVEALIQYARSSGVKKLNIHPIADGKDSERRSAFDLIKKLEKVITEVGVGVIGSIGGRYYGLDRDEHFDRTKKAYNAILGQTNESPIDTWLDATYKQGLEDEYIEPVTVNKNNSARPGDVIIFWDFREDSIRQLANEFIASKQFHVTTFTEYKESFDVPVAFPQEEVATPLGKILADHDKVQLRIAETEKYAHVTYFFNGLKETLFKNEYRVLVPSQNIARHDEHPEMRAREISERVIQAIEERGTDFILANFANSDMVAHTGNFDAAVTGIEVIDHEVRRIFDATLAHDGILIITSDHGNVEQMIHPLTGNKETQHNVSPVPFYLVGKEFVSIKSDEEVKRSEEEITGILSDVAPTILELMQLPIPNEMTGTSLIGMLR